MQRNPHKKQFLIEKLRSPLALDRASAVRGLAEMGANLQEIAPALAQALKDSDESVRRNAAWALGRGGLCQEAVKALVEALGDEDWRVRVYVADALAEMGPAASEAVPGLIENLTDQDPEDLLRSPAAEALVQIGREAVPPLIGALATKQYDVRCLGIKALVGIGDAAVPQLLKALQDKNLRVRKFAAEALGEIGDQEALPALVDALSDKNHRVRLAVVEALGAIGINSAAVPSLIQMLKEGNERIRQSAAKALGCPAGREALGALIDALRDSKTQVRVAAAKALVRIGSDAVVQAWKDGNRETWRAIVNAVIEVGPHSLQPEEVVRFFELGHEEGCIDLEHIEVLLGHEDLDPLRQRDDFRELIEKISNEYGLPHR